MSDNKTLALAFRLILFFCLLFGLALAARATTITISAVSIPNIQAGAGTYELRIWLDRTMVDSLGVTYVGGAVDSPNGYKRVACALVSTTVTCDTFTLASTVDAQQGADAKYAAKLYRNNAPLLLYNKPFALPASLGASVTWEQIWRYNNTVPNRVLDNEYYTKNQVNALYTGSLFANPATTTSRGVGKSSMNVADPVFVETTDPRVPTQGENDALAGAYGTPSSSNKFVTDSDPRIPSQGENDALVGTSGTPSSTNKYVTNADARLTGMWLNVRSTTYGATGDGTTDDTAAINAAIAACNAAGGGVIYLPRPTSYYKITAATTSISAPCTVRGDGSGSSPSAVAWTTKVVQTSRTANAFTFTGDSGGVESIYIFNSNSTYGGSAPATPPTAGAGIAVVASSSSTRVNLVDVVVEGFYDDVIQDGAHWSISRSHLINPVRYALSVTNTVNADAGDWSVIGSWFTSKTYMAAAAIRIVSGAGGKISGCKFNTYDDPAISGATGFTDHISVDITSIGILLITGNSLENVSRYSIDVNNSLEVNVTGNQFGHYIAGSQAAINMVGTADSVIDANIFRGSLVSGSPAVQLANCSKCLVGPSNVNNGFGAMHTEAGTYSTGGPTHLALTLTNGWANVGGGLATAGFALHGGVVYVKATVINGSPADGSVFTLPVGMRPAQDTIFPGTFNTVFQRIRVNTDGTVVPEGLASSAGALSLNFSFIPAP
jgi:hypothetical protein